MAWQIKFTETAKKQLARIDHQAARRITRFLLERVAMATSPRGLGHPLKSVLRGFWRYRVGDYRLICQIEDKVMLVLVIRVGHRKDIYDA